MQIMERKSDWQERFWKKVDKTDYCWVWTASKSRAGYGFFGLEGKAQYAHRISFVLAGNEIPPGLVLDHLCRRPECVNPEHLEAVTNRVNAHRGKNGLKAYCKHGHPYDSVNTCIRKDGTRMCRQCKRGWNNAAARLRRGVKYVYINCSQCGARFCGRSSQRQTIKYCSNRCGAKSSMAAFKLRQAHAAGQHFGTAQNTAPA